MIGAFVFEISSERYQKVYYNDVDDFYKNSIWGEFWFKSAVMLGTATCIILPLNLQKNISKLRYTSVFGIFCLLGITVVIIIQLPSYYSFHKSEITFNVNWYDVSTAFTSDLYFFKGTATLFYAYSCHYGAFPVYEKLTNHTEKRINKVLVRSIIVDALFYLTVGICGYLTQPFETPNLIIKRKKIPGESDITMTICRILMCLTLFAKIPANFNSMRISLFNIIFKNSEITLKR